MKLWLQNIGTTTQPSQICLDEFPFIIGRRRDCQGCLPYAFISRHHCEFVQENDRVLVKDLESYNGTLVNGRSALKPLGVVDGDEITIGPMSFRVVMPRADAETARSILTQPEVDAPAPAHSSKTHDA
jgi:pSer/pThr/pTyr-binding forkhead associated (FHA) protein